MKSSNASLLFNAGGGLIGLVLVMYAVGSLFSADVEGACDPAYDRHARLDYEKASGAPASAMDLQARMGGSKAWGVHENVTPVKASASSDTTVLDIRLPKGSINPNHPEAPLGGVGFRWRPKGLEKAKAACLSYALHLPADFEFQKGGKLPGLFGGSAPAGGTKADGTNGFSVRYMWRAKGQAEVYAYIPGHPTGRGQTIQRGAFELNRGAWNRLVQEVVLNTPGQSDGLLRVWHDGKLVINRNNVRYRDTDTLGVDGVMADIFYGGSDESYAAPKTTSVKLSPIDVRWRGK